MGVVIRFEPKKDSGGSRLERELAVPYGQAIAGPLDTGNVSEPQKTAKAGEIRLGPAILILFAFIMALLIVAFHLSDRHEYSARANLLPSEFRIVD